MVFLEFGVCLKDRTDWVSYNTKVRLNIGFHTLSI